MDFLDDVLSEAPAAKVPAASKFKPKGKARAKKGPSKAANSVIVKDTVEKAPSSDLPSSVQADDIVKEKSEAPTSSSHTETKDIVDSSTTTTEPPETHAQDVLNIHHEATPVIPDVSVASYSPFITQPDSEDFQINVEQLEAGDFSSLDAVETMIEAGGAAGKRTKLTPKPKAQERGNDKVETLSPDDQLVTDDSVHVGGLDSFHKSSDTDQDVGFSLNPTADQSQSVIFEDTDTLMSSEILEQIGNEGNLDGLNSSGDLPNEGHVLSGAEVDEDMSEFVEGTTDTIHVNSESPTKAQDDLTSNREENIPGDHIEEEKPKKKRGRKPKNAASENDKPGRKPKNAASENDKSGRKPKNAASENDKPGRKPKNAASENDKPGRKQKNAASENDKPTRKRKKVAEKPVQSVVEPPKKKFPHATRRKRCVDKSLLEVAEEELDLHKLPIKDLILLAEHREREKKKQVPSVQPAPTIERINNFQSEDVPYDDDTFGFNQDREIDENPSTSGVQTDTGYYYNYGTHRKKQARAKWSKKDTEMFYQGIRQFGTDLSMIQQLFPGRTLEQIRSKYRKEQKQNPMMMDDAQMTRATDNSCFELVIKTLEAAREYDSSDDDLAHLTGKEGKAEDTPETHAAPEEGANSEQNPKDEADKETVEIPEVGSPVKSNVDDDDWDDYTGL